MSDEPYAYGRTCTWHGPTTFASLCVSASSCLEYCCPKCGLELHLTTEQGFWRVVKMFEHAVPGYEEMMRWSQGKCFADFQLLQETWRKVMEGRE